MLALISIPEPKSPVWVGHSPSPFCFARGLGFPDLLQHVPEHSSRHLGTCVFRDLCTSLQGAPGTGTRRAVPSCQLGFQAIVPRTDIPTQGMGLLGVG